MSAPQDPRISYVVARLDRALRVAIAERLSPHGLTTLQYTTLSILGRRGQPLSNAQLARRAYMAPQSMSEVIAALQAKGLIKRRAHPNHRRVLPVALTPKGERVLAECEQVVDALEDEMLGGVSAGERAALLEALKGAVRALGAGFTSAASRQ